MKVAPFHCLRHQALLYKRFVYLYSSYFFAFGYFLAEEIWKFPSRADIS